jgi:predicted dehydrogenase
MDKGKVGVCIIGAGRAGMIHALNFRSRVPNAYLAAVVDPYDDVAKTAADKLEIERYYTDYHQALDDDNIDAVVVVTPTVYHKEIVINAARAGKHVLCEKPMAMDENECELMIQETKRAKVKLQIGFMRRFDESYVHAKEALDAGEIGDIVLVKSLTRGPSVPQRWMYDIDKSNGPLAEVNSHDIDTVRWFSESEFSSVYAIGGNYRCKDVKNEYPDFYDNVVMNAKLANGTQGVIDGGVSVKYGYDARTEIVGTMGVIFIGQVHEKSVVVCSDSKGQIRPLMNSWRSLFKDAYLAEDTHFVDCILNDSTPKVTGVDGKMAVKVVTAGNRSIKEGSVIEL